jgi:AcrR family transcriptional regulator
MATGTTTTDKPRRRSQRAEQAILDATLALFAEQGFAGLSIDGIAARAGVGKTTIYRHWTGKAHLVVDAFRRAIPPLPAPDTGTLRDDLVEIAGHLAEGLSSSTLSRLLPSLVEGAEHDAEVRRLFSEFGAERRTVLRGVLERGRDRGELSPGLDLDLAADLLTGPIFGRRLVTRAPLDRAFAVRLVDTLMPALRA